MTNFIPDAPKAKTVPLFEDVKGDAGWQGQATGKGELTLKAEISTAITRLGGIVTGFQRGVFVVDGKNRDGYKIMYSLDNEGGNFIPGRIEIAALPCRISSHREQSLKMALYMIRNAIDGLWFLSQLSPGYAPLMPFMLVEGGQTVSQLWSKSAVMSNLLPPPGSDFIDGNYKEVTK